VNTPDACSVLVNRLLQDKLDRTTVLKAQSNVALPISLLLVFHVAHRTPWDGKLLIQKIERDLCRIKKPHTMSAIGFCLKGRRLH
jgi:hypothetical protein